MQPFLLFAPSLSLIFRQSDFLIMFLQPDSPPPNPASFYDSVLKSRVFLPPTLYFIVGELDQRSPNLLSITLVNDTIV